MLPYLLALRALAGPRLSLMPDQTIDEIKVILCQFIGFLDQDGCPVSFFKRKGFVGRDAGARGAAGERCGKKGYGDFGTSAMLTR